MLSRSLWQPFALLTPLTILVIWWSFRTQDGAANGPGTSFSNISKHGEGFEQIQDTIPKRAIAIRCKHAIGDWCLRALSSNLTTTATPPTLGTRSCTAGCNGVGNCNADTGACDCPAGWKGEGCLQRDPRPCTNKYRSSGGQPSGQPASWSEAVLGPRATGVCTGVCDDDIAACFCNGSHANPELPRTGKPARYPPALLGRYMGIQCQPTRADDGRPLPWGQHEPESLFGKDSGWCEAERPALRCECKLDGMAGNACELPVEQTCINQCSGRGACYLGFCKCFDGWYGHACHRQSGASSAAELDLTERPWVRRHLVKPETMAGQRKRPLVYIYDLPSEFNTRMHQYRTNKHTCTWRLFNEYNNESYISSWTYGLEMAFHEALLQSKHHTPDPEQADFFYVPVYTSCFIHPVWGYVDHPWYYGPTQHCREEGGNTYCATGANRVMQAMFMLLEAKRWIERELPWWARKQGRDHLWLVTHDEGSCWVPAEIRNSIILSHWGRKDKGHRSNSAFAPWDNYTDEVVYPEWWPDGYQNYIDAENNACYDPKTDLVVPVLKHPADIGSSALLGNPQHNITTLLLFRGDVGAERQPHYSRGIRQTLHTLAWEQDWRGRHGILIGSREEIEGDYSQLLSSSLFCLVVPGDGFSTRAEDAVLHGCLPVVIMDDVDPVFASILDWDSFSVRVPEAEVVHLPKILKSIPRSKIQAMQQAIRSVWQRFMWSSMPILDEIVAGLCQSNNASTAVVKDESSEDTGCITNYHGDDAFGTVMQWLASRA